jgi:hypothetical protein
MEVNMPVGAIIVLVIVCVLLVVAATLGIQVARRVALRRQFGAEYDRLVDEVGPRRAQAQLEERRRRAARLDIRPLSAAQRAGYDKQWTAAQERFVSSPAEATEATAALVIAVATDRGYSVGREEFLAELSVHHAPRLDGYRKALRTTDQGGTAGTEELRQALLEYRALFRDLLGASDSVGSRPAVPADAKAGGVTTDGADATAVRTADAREAGPVTEAETGAAEPVAEDKDMAAESAVVSNDNGRATAQAPRKG